MGEAEDIEKITQALKTVPEKHLLIVDLARQVVNEKGELDYDLLADRQRDVNLAIAEAKAYSNATIRAIETLRGLKAHPGGQV